MFYKKLRDLGVAPFFLLFLGNGRNIKWYVGIRFIAQKRLLFSKFALLNFNIILNIK